MMNAKHAACGRKPRAMLQCMSRNHSQWELEAAQPRCLVQMLHIW